MADQIQPTPRSPMLGLFSDAINLPLEYMSSPQRTQQMQGMAQFLYGTGIPKTLERMSYGESLFSGAGGLGGTARMRPETADALMNVAPFISPTAKFANQGAMVVGKAGEQYAEKVLPQIMERGGLPAQLLLDLSQGSRSQMLLGKSAKEMQPLIAQAELLSKQGIPDYKITEITGLERVPMGQGRMSEWGKQIPDVGATLNLKAVESLKTPLEKTIGYSKQTPIENVTVGNLLDHPELFNAYPEIKNIPVEKVNGFLSIGGTQAYYDPAKNTIGLTNLNQFMMDKIDKQLSEKTSSLLHELQHYIQTVEQWPRGGSTSEFSKKSTDKIQKQISSIDKVLVEKAKDLTNEKFISPFDLKTINDYRNGKTRYITDTQKKLFETDGIETILNQFEKFEGIKNKIKYRENNAYKNYKSLAGEAQARATQKQYETGEMTVPLTKSYDVPVESLIYRDPFGNTAQ